MTAPIAPPEPTVESPPIGVGSTPPGGSAPIKGRPSIAPAGGLAGLRERTNIARDVLPIAALLALVIYFSARSSSFASTANFTLITGQAGILLLAALGATLVIIAGSVDLSVGSIALLTGAITAYFIVHVSESVPLVVATAIVVGGVIGLVNGVVFAYGRVPSFIATLGTLSLFAGIGLTILKGSQISFDSESLQDLAVGQLIPHVQNAALFALVGLGVLGFIARRTRLGLYIYAIGGNEQVVQLAGVKTQRVKVLVFVVSGITAGFAGLLLSAQLGAAGPSLGSQTLLDSVAAIVIGGTALSGGVGSVNRTLLGVLILVVLSNGLNQIGAADYTQTIIKGLVIIIAAVFTMASQRKLIVK